MMLLLQLKRAESASASGNSCIIIVSKMLNHNISYHTNCIVDVNRLAVVDRVRFRVYIQYPGIPVVSSVHIATACFCQDIQRMNVCASRPIYLEHSLPTSQ